MATSGSFLSENQFQCIICLDLYTEPVSIPCGHNFCKACISRHWEEQKQRQCPLCKEKFDKGIKLHVNTGLRHIVDNFKKHYATTQEDSPVEPGQVLCDCCPGNKSKASKTCLVCLTSYCETHLEPHKRVDALKRHKLTNPVRNLEDKICKKHNRIMQICRKDMTRFCILCKEESDQDSVPFQVSYGFMGAQIVKEIRPLRGKKARKKRAQKQAKSENTEKVDAARESILAHVVWLLNPPCECCRTYWPIPGQISMSGGKFYYEVQTAGLRSWQLGVTRVSNEGKIPRFPRPSNGNWLIGCWNNSSYTAFAERPVPVPYLKKPSRIHVCVNYEAGLVFFCDADSANVICTFHDCHFDSDVILYFRPTENESWKHWLQEKYSNMNEKDQTVLKILAGFFVFAILVIYLQTEMILKKVDQD